MMVDDVFGVTITDDVVDDTMVELTPRERSVVEHWCGSGKETWKSLNKLPGNEFTAKFVRECLVDIRVIRAIRVFEGRGSAGVLNKVERQQFWSGVVLDDEQRMADRLKASELLGRTAMDFREVVEITGNQDFARAIGLARERSRLSHEIDIEAEVV